MSSLGDLYTHLKTLCEQWFYNKSTIDGYLNNKISKSSTVGLVKNDGSIDTTQYSTFSGDYDDLTDKPSIPTKTSDLTNDGDGTNVFVKNNDSRLSDARTPTAHNQASSTITDTNTYTNIGNTNSTQESINSAINTKLGQLSEIDAINVVSTLPSASSSTMGKLYSISENSKINVYYTKENNGSYSWHEMDADILDNLSIDWDDVANKPSLFSGSYNDLSDKPSSFTPSSHTHGNITNDGLITGSTYAHRTLVKPLGYYTNSNNEIVKCSSLSAYTILDSNAHSNIGSSANATQETINSSIDTALGGKVSSSDLGSVAFSNSYDDLDDLPTLFSGDYDDLINKPNIPSGVVVDTTLSSSSSNAIANSTVTTALNGKVDSNDSRLSDARTPTSHTHGYVQNGGTLTQTGTNNGSIVVTNSSNKIVIQSSIDVLDGLVQDLITYGSS